ncbi:MAG: hypothetical protein HY290_31040 [Planctomycetia bacterium]|nr:hypothetical protein [Planctomycetia bacterium]
MLQVGLIGLGDEWEHRFRPALERLNKRLEVQCVYATVGRRAAQAAAELDCDVAPGLVTLIEREDVRALLVLETDWQAEVPARLACELHKPAFLAGRLADRLSQAQALAHRASEAGVTLMPDLGHRYTPATSRLRELIATRLGRPLAIEIIAMPGARSAVDAGAVQSTDRGLLAAAIDWCTSLVGTAPTAVVPARHSEPAGGDGPPQRYDVQFRRPSAGGDAACATVEIHGANGKGVSNGNGAASPTLRARIRCAQGSALLEPPCGITWESGLDRSAESLTSDRADIEVMLDHFSRRVLGGLIPVPTLEDVCRARELAEGAG